MVPVPSLLIRWVHAMGSQHNTHANKMPGEPGDKKKKKERKKGCSRVLYRAMHTIRLNHSHFGQLGSAVDVKSKKRNCSRGKYEFVALQYRSSN